jgi:pimeloyl-ACP methyl ester carboxylesterase
VDRAASSAYKTGILGVVVAQAEEGIGNQDATQTLSVNSPRVHSFIGTRDTECSSFEIMYFRVDQLTDEHYPYVTVENHQMKHLLLFVLIAAGSTTFISPTYAGQTTPGTVDPEAATHYRSMKVDGVDVFYREAGPQKAPVLLLLHGFPTSSQMFRDLIPRLSDKYHIVAPDYPGFGYSSAPDHTQFAYTFQNYANIVDKLMQELNLSRYALYVMDYGAPVGFRLATMHPDRVTAIVVQNGNAYDEGIGSFWDGIKAYWKTGAPKEREAIRWLMLAKTTHWQYTNGVKDVTLVSPDAATVDQVFLDRPGNQEVQLDLFYDYRTNIPLYPEWQAYFRKYQPPMLIVWGQNDEIFIAPGAKPYQRDIPSAEIHMVDTGHFALETNGPEIAGLMRDFLDRKVSANRQ